ncbi:MAG: hypothetical protein KDA61_02530 [Planctomycetales bacterium]|nr:hypothetical protein [Planctomycetales bacterium]
MARASRFRRKKASRRKTLNRSLVANRRLGMESLEDRRVLATLGFQFGIDDNGGLAIRNTSANN